MARIVSISLLLVISLFILIIPQNSFAQEVPFTVEEAEEFLDLAAKEALLEFKDYNFEEFKRAVYKEPSLWGVYIVNGDTPIANDRLLREFFDQNISGVGSSSTQFFDQSLMFSSFSHDLIIGRANNLDTVWNSERKNALTYCVSTVFGERYNLVVASMVAAAEAWEAAADVDFVHVIDEDDNCTATNLEVIFDVQPISSQPYLARAFFPNFPRAQRNILIDETSFELDPNENLQLVGILRHELGHTLGARHEHTRPEAKNCFEDINWRGITDYDAFSVMHYPHCNGQGDLSLTLTDLDKNGMACIYGAAPGFTIDESICRTVVRVGAESSIDREFLFATEIRKSNTTTYCLNLHGNFSKNGSVVNLWSCNGHESQKWSFYSDGTIRAFPDKCLNLHGNFSENDSVVNLWSCNGHESQKWSFHNDGTIRAFPDKCLNLHGDLVSSGAKVNLWSCTGHQSMSWEFSPNL